MKIKYEYDYPMIIVKNYSVMDFGISYNKRTIWDILIFYTEFERWITSYILTHGENSVYPIRVIND